MFIRTGKLYAALVVSLFLLAACSAGSDTSPTESETSTDDTTSEDASGGSDAEADDDLVRIGLVAEPASLDFTTTDGAAIPQLLLKNVYETLVTIDVDSGEIVPALAASW